MSNSEIFDRFVKIAQDTGMVSKDAPEKAKKKLEKDPRWDSLDISAIEALYGVKPNAPKGMEYERNIIENAHPNSVVVAPSYDKLNGLVENENERQDISLHILNKTPDGHGNLHKNARKDFVLTLVRLANDLDNRNAEQLRALADVCLEQVAVSKTIQKRAWVPLAVGVSSALGALYVQQHMAFTNEGFQKNHEKLVAEVDDLLNSNSDWGVGSQYTQEFKSMLQEFKGKLLDFYAMYQKYYSIIVSLEKPKTAKELIALSQKPETDAVAKAYKVLRAAADDMLPYIATIERNFASESYKTRQVEDKGILTSLVDKVQVLRGGKGLVADDFDDVVRAIAPYKKSVGEMLDVFRKAGSVENSAKTQIQQANAESQKEFGPESAPAPTQTPTPTSPAKDLGMDELENELAKGLL